MFVSPSFVGREVGVQVGDNEGVKVEGVKVGGSEGGNEGVKVEGLTVGEGEGGNDGILVGVMDGSYVGDIVGPEVG